MKILHSFPRWIDIWWAEKLLLDRQEISDHKHYIFTCYVRNELLHLIKENTQIILWNTTTKLLETIQDIDPEVIIQHWEFYDLSKCSVPECRYLHVETGAKTSFSWYESKERGIISSVDFHGLQWKIKNSKIIKLWIDLPKNPRKKSVDYENPVFGILWRINSQKISEEFLVEWNNLFKNKIQIKMYWKIEDNTRNKNHSNRANSIQKHNNAIKYCGTYNQNDLKDIFESVDAVIIPSLFETWWYVALEAQSYWVPVFWLSNWWLPGHVYYTDHLRQNYKDLCMRIGEFLHDHEKVDADMIREYIFKEHNRVTQILKLDKTIKEMVE